MAKLVEHVVRILLRKEKNTSKNCLQTITLSLFLTYFIAFGVCTVCTYYAFDGTYKSILNFLSEPTLTSVTIEQNQTLQLPPPTFCVGITPLIAQWQQRILGSESSE